MLVFEPGACATVRSRSQVMDEAEKVLHLVASLKGHEFTLKPYLIGGAAYDAFSDHCPSATLEVSPRLLERSFSIVNRRPNRRHAPPLTPSCSDRLVVPLTSNISRSGRIAKRMHCLGCVKRAQT